tara:strand:+ start:757 stop:3471 length:2715 start_codon:yes stop_codon:yes gene_type:complete
MATNSEIEFDEQSFLWDFYELFQNAILKKTTPQNKPPAGTRTGANSSLSRLLQKTTNELNATFDVEPTEYKNFLQLRDSEPHLTLNKITGNNANTLQDLTSAQLSALIPHIKIYKTIKVKNKEVDIEFPFGSTTNLSDITESILDRGIDAGIQNITWADTGTNPANVGLAFKGTMTFFFQSFESIFKTRNVGRYKLSFADLLDKTEALGQKAGPSNLQQANNANKINQPKIKLEVGWSVPDDVGNVLNMRDVSERIKGNRRSYILENLNQQININEQDGSLTLDIDFIAALEGRMMSTNADLLYIDESDVSDPLAVQKKELRELADKQYKKIRTDKKAALARQREAQLLIQRQQNDAQMSLPNDPARQTIEDAEREIERLKEENREYKKRRAEIRSLSYKRLLNTIRSDNFLKTKSLNRTDLNLGSANLLTDGKIRYFDVSSNIINQYKDMLVAANLSVDKRKELLDDNRGETAQKREGIIERHKADFKEERQLALSNINSLLKETLMNSSNMTSYKSSEGFKPVNIAPTNQSTAGQQDSQSVESQNRPPLYYERPDGTRRIQYFFLGDLIEAVMEILYYSPETNTDGDKVVNKANMNSKEFMEEMKIMMGSLNYTNPTTGLTANIQIADIPVSFNYFNGWFYDNVIKRQLSTYPLKSFLRDLCAKLVNNLLSPKRYGVIASRRPLRTVTQSVWVDTNSELNQYWKKNLSIHKPRFSVDKFYRRASKKTGYMSKPTEFIYIYVVGGEMNNLANTAKLARSSFNRQRNIPHYIIGNQTGLLRNINFSRTQIPYKFEASLSEEASSIRKNLLFQDKYDAKITLLGNAIFKPGMLLYVDPLGLGLGEGIRKPRAVVSDYRYNLGIGGYYRVVSVNNEISAEGFTTSLDTVAELDLRDIKFISDKRNK